MKEEKADGRPMPLHHLTSLIGNYPKGMSQRFGQVALALGNTHFDRHLPACRMAVEMNASTIEPAPPIGSSISP
tara:strand:- start:264 stop:485 length:222 start_codon:yes stop_codon:yes gene_type:complete